MEGEAWGGGGNVVGEEVGEVGEDAWEVVEDAEKLDEVAAEVVDDDVEVAVTRSVEGMLGSSCMLLMSGLPPASPRAAIPHVFGLTPSLDVRMKRGVFS